MTWIHWLQRLIQLILWPPRSVERGDIGGCVDKMALEAGL